MKQTIIINGVGGCGKDTFVREVSEHIPTENISSIDPMYKMARLCGWNGTKMQHDRWFFSELKKLATAYNDFPYVRLTSHIKQFNGIVKSKYDVMNGAVEPELLFIHIREPHEIKRIVDYCNSKKYSVTTLLIKNKLSPAPEAYTTSTDKEVEGYKYDCIIEHSGEISDWQQEAIQYINYIKERQDTNNPV